ncbi:uncharacterized protein BO72DRAFT_147310 [Aspergillus fijiensis CBS 313.89]|uniref:Uncharacterized protein n=1 Tax=Aspergillus fijiensis CBS 313.89 TaxID=1448319 RepID=A0A8G1RL97_9EURO|nr:uncharacterized protein BO72DRAFT_147310 [Aspergillus fijiensis CBS 313.89]RAK76087.1 hypothetical protein BO72DRAFT_147310 [Aspergillus fijiensis CBS 313.89]
MAMRYLSYLSLFVHEGLNKLCWPFWKQRFTRLLRFSPNAVSAWGVRGPPDPHLASLICTGLALVWCYLSLAGCGRDDAQLRPPRLPQWFHVRSQSCVTSCAMRSCSVGIAPSALGTWTSRGPGGYESLEPNDTMI